VILGGKATFTVGDELFERVGERPNVFEMYFFKINPPDGFGMVRYYNAEIDGGYVVRDNTILMAPNGYHTVVSAPGYTTYLLWFLTGKQRVLASVEDPALAWISRTAPMLRAVADLTHLGF